MGFLSSLFGRNGRQKQGHADAAEEGANGGGVDVTAQLNHLLMPMDRGDQYEDPLDDLLKEKGFGGTEGGGTMQLESGEIEYIDVEITLNDLEDGIPYVIEQLEAMGAPKGSILRIHDADPSREIPFGKAEGIGVYLDGATLPDEVYEQSEINLVIEECNKRLSGHGQMQSYWEGQTETALYFYGEDAEQMKTLIRDFLDEYPLCKGARVVTLAPK